ncbi:MAG: hypothetical protein ACN2B6_08250 [Rickettsiales bacterium]
MPGKNFIKRNVIKKIFGFLSRFIVYTAAWYLLWQYGAQFIMSHIHDIEGIYMYMGIGVALPFIILIWLIVDLTFVIKKRTNAELWIITLKTFLLTVLLSPLFSGFALLLGSWFTHLTK